MHTPATVLDAAAVLIRALVDTVLCELIDEVPISGVELQPAKGHRMRVWDTQVSVPVRDDPTLQCFFWTVARPPQKSRMTTSHNRDLTH